MNYGSFNSFGYKSDEYEQTHKPVWLGTVSPRPIGGVLASDFRKNGALYAAGTPIYYYNKTITPLVSFEVVSYTAATTGNYDTIVVYPCTFGGVTVIPAVGDILQALGATFATTAKAAAVVAVTALTGDDAGKYSFTVDKTTNLGSLSAGDLIVYSASTSAGSSKSMANQPNAYLYNDIYLTADSDINATGAAVDFHGEGILIGFCPAAAVAAQMKAAVPNVIQVAL